MRVELLTELEDVPGSLVNLLATISKVRGNIISVVHERAKRKERKVPVHVVFEVDKSKLDDISNDLKSHGIKVIKLTKKVEKSSFDLMLVGHIINTDIKNTLDRIHGDHVIVSELDIRMLGPANPSSVYMTIEADNEEELEKARDKLKKIATEKKLTIIKSL